MLKKIWAAIINYFWSFYYIPLTDAEVKEFYNRFENFFELANYLNAAGFRWESLGDNVTKETDVFIRPNNVLSMKKGNCSDYMRLFSEFIRYRRCADRIEETLLYNDGLGSPWHYVLVIQDRGTLYLQSNMAVSLLTQKVLDEFKGKYAHQKVIDTWTK